jgi:hypothetical protein
MRPGLKSLFLFSTFVAISTGMGTAGAADEDITARLDAAGHALRSNVVRPGRPERYGRAYSMIKAPVPAVRAVLLDFKHYKSFAPDKFSNVHVVGKDAKSTDVSMQIPIMHGMLTLSQILRFGPPETLADGTEQIEGKFVRGSQVKDADIVFTLKKLDDEYTLLTCDILIVPTLPAPQSAIDEELRDSALKAVDAVHIHAQGGDFRTYLFAGPNRGTRAPEPK